MNHTAYGSIAGRPNFSIKRAYNPDCQCGVEAKRITNGHDLAPDGEFRGVAHRQFGEVARWVNDAENGEISLRRQADHLGLKGLFVREGDGQTVGSRDHVVVGDYQTRLCIPDEAGARSPRDFGDVPGEALAT